MITQFNVIEGGAELKSDLAAIGADSHAHFAEELNADLAAIGAELGAYPADSEALDTYRKPAI